MKIMRAQMMHLLIVNIREKMELLQTIEYN